LFPGAFSRRMETGTSSYVTQAGKRCEERDGCLGIAEFVVSPKVVITDMIFYYDQLYSGPSVALEATDAMGCFTVVKKKVKSSRITLLISHMPSALKFRRQHQQPASFLPHTIHLRVLYVQRGGGGMFFKRPRRHSQWVL
jgi:hypothetical protein